VVTPTSTPSPRRSSAGPACSAGGTAFAALLGIIVIQSISSGLTLLNLDSSIRFMVTGAVVLVAVSLDAYIRRSRSSHGR